MDIYSDFMLTLIDTCLSCCCSRNHGVTAMASQAPLQGVDATDDPRGPGCISTPDPSILQD